jgi:hypothetical protein
MHYRRLAGGRDDTPSLLRQTHCPVASGAMSGLLCLVATGAFTQAPCGRLGVPTRTEQAVTVVLDA